MNPTQPSRRTFLVGAIAANFAGAAGLSACGPDGTPTWPQDVRVPSNRQKEPAPFTPTRSVSITATGGAPTSKDNSKALAAAFAEAGARGEVTLPAGTFAFTSPVDWPTHPVRLRGAQDAEGTTLAFAPSVVHGLGVRGKGAGGSWLSHLTLTGTSSAQLFIQSTGGDQFVVESCSFLDAPTFAVQIDGASLFVRSSQFHGKADGSMTAVHAMHSGTKLTVVDSSITGCFRGLYCAGVDDVTASGLFVNPMWWCGNPKAFTSSLASADATSLTTRTPLAPRGGQRYTVTAWKQISSDARIAPADRANGWYDVTGVDGLEPRMMLRTDQIWGTVLEVKGQQVRVHAFHDWSTCHPVAAPSGVLDHVMIERPYIAGIQSMSGTQAQIVDRWKAGAKATVEIPPAGARVTITPAPDYQIFGTDGTKSMSATGCTVMNSWADSISTIASSNALIAKNDIWDSQDVGVTIQQGTGACRVEENTMHRIGTAGVFIGTSEAQVVGNTINGAQHTAVKEDSYAALQIEGAEKVAVWKNHVVYGGSPFEVRAMIIEGRYGPFPQSDPKKGPFATNGYYKENTFSGYPKALTIPAPPTEKGLEMVEVTVRGEHASARIGEWAEGTRFQALDGAHKDKIHA